MSTENTYDLGRRSKTYNRFSDTIKYPVSRAKSKRHGLLYESHLFKLLQQSNKFKWIDITEKDSNRGNIVIYCISSCI